MGCERRSLIDCFRIDVLEVHPQRGDTLLHLICYCKNFTSRTAELFQTIFQAKAAGHSMKKNIRGETFLHVHPCETNQVKINSKNLVDVSRRTSTYVDVCGRLSTYVDVRGRTTTYVDVGRRYVDQNFGVNFNLLSFA